MVEVRLSRVPRGKEREFPPRGKGIAAEAAFPVPGESGWGAGEDAAHCHGLWSAIIETGGSAAAFDPCRCTTGAMDFFCGAVV